MAHHLIIQKEVDELLAKGTIEPSAGAADLYSDIFWFLSTLVIDHQYSPQAISLLYVHTYSFKMPTITQVWQLTQQCDYAFAIDLKDTYLCNNIV